MMMPTTPRRSPRRRLGLALGTWLLAQCTAPTTEPEQGPLEGSSDRPTPAARPSTAPQVVDYGPCTSVLGDAPGSPLRCAFDPKQRLRLWLAHPVPSDLRVLVDGQPVSVDALVPVDEHTDGVAVRLPQGAARLEVRLGEGLDPWVLLLASPASDLDQPATPSALEDRLRAWQPRPDWRVALPEVLDALGHDGLIERQVTLVEAVAYHLASEHRFDEAAEALTAAPAAASGAPRLAAMLAYARGVLEWRRGHYDDALDALRDTSLHAVRAREDDLATAALPMYGELLAEQGYYEAALKWSQVGLERARMHGDACSVASTLRTTAWVQLLLRQHAQSNLDPAPMLEESLAYFEPGGKCPRPDRTGGARASLALLELLEGNPGQALALTRKIDLGLVTPAEQVLALDVELRARLALGHGSGQIQRTLAQLRRAMGLADTVDARWHLVLREGQILEASGEHEAAISAYREAEGHVDRLAQLAAFGVGRSAVGLTHRESSERLVDALRARGHLDDALCAARQAEARRLYAATLSVALPRAERLRVDERVAELRQAQAELDTLLVREREAPDDEQEAAHVAVVERLQRLEDDTAEILRIAGHNARPPACEDLHEPPPGELLLGLFPRGDDWVLFAHDRKETLAVGLELREIDQTTARARLSELLLRPVARFLRRAERVRVHVVGRMQALEVELLPWEGKPLIAQVPVVWGIDAARPGPRALEPSGPAPRGLLLADPSGSLPEADAEIEHAARTLRRMGWAVDEVPRAQALPFAVLARMSEATLMHYAGHATHDERLQPGSWPPYAGGTPSWPASLRLGEDAGLAAHEILIGSTRVPRSVILSACRTGPLDAGAGGMSLAVAFILAGSSEVLATSVSPDDRSARVAMQDVYEALAGGSEWSLAEAYARTQARRLATGEPMKGYRVWVR